MAIVRSAIITVLCFFFCVNASKAQWIVDEEFCRTPDKAQGTCIVHSECKPITDWLKAAPKPLSIKDRKLLMAYQCGFDVASVKVCCPNTPIIKPEPDKKAPLTSAKIPDVTQHKNLKLVPQTQCGLLQTDDRILNGNVTALFEFPWMALISYRTVDGLQFRCGGSVINDRYILTAAHCITSLKDMTIAGIRLGEHNISTPIDCETPPEGDTVCADPVQDIGVEAIIPHPKYNNTPFSNDIGLIRLASKANLSTDSVKPVCLPITPDVNNPTLTKVIVTGWGRTLTDIQSNVLLKVDVPVVPHKPCVEAYTNITSISHLQLCAGGKDLKDTCGGDSGGPLQVIGNIDNDARYIQYGIVSFGPKPCGRQGLPGVYTKVAYYLDWILDTIKP